MHETSGWMPVDFTAASPSPTPLSHTQRLGSNCDQLSLISGEHWTPESARLLLEVWVVASERFHREVCCSADVVWTSNDSLPVEAIVGSAREMKNLWVLRMGAGSVARVWVEEFLILGFSIVFSSSS